MYNAECKNITRHSAIFGFKKKATALFGGMDKKSHIGFAMFFPVGFPDL